MGAGETGGGGADTGGGVTVGTGTGGDRPGQRTARGVVCGQQNMSWEAAIGGVGTSGDPRGRRSWTAGDEFTYRTWKFRGDKNLQAGIWGTQVDRDDLLRRFVQMQYTRNDLAFTRGTFRVRGDTLEVFPVYEELAIRIEFFGDEVERLMTLHPVTGEVVTEDDELHIFPATHYVAGPERMERAINGIEAELEERLATFERQGKLLESQRLRMPTT